jgi:DNA-binding NarL/FixJ family response regulator
MPDKETKRPGSTLALVDDHGVVHFAMGLLAEEEGFEWLGGCGTPEEALVFLEARRPGILVLDLVLGGRDRLDLLGEILKASPLTKILVYSSLPEETYGHRCLRLGAHAYVPKSSDMNDLRQALRSVSRDEIWASPGVIRSLARDGTVDSLSNRELHVFRLLGQGLKPRAIAEQLQLSSKTIHTYCERLKVKLSAESLDALQRMAFEQREW